MSESILQIESPAEGIRLLRLNRPERRNALSIALVSELHRACDTLKIDRDCRVVILSGSGDAFCAGADIRERDVYPPGGEGMSQLGIVYKSQEHLAELILKLHELPQPVIAAVNGVAVGGGLALTLASDIRIAEERASFGAVFIKIGLSSCDVGVSYLLPRIVGVSRAAEMMLTGRIFDSAEAEEAGMLYRRCADHQSGAEALKLAEAIAENNEYGVWMTKRGLWTNLDAPSLRHAIEIENRTQALGWFSGNMEEAMQAFVEKRSPRWKRL